MTDPVFLSLVWAAVGGLVVGGAAYWIATRPEKPSKQHPAE